ncbi:ATP-binding cassette domain-containing protein [Arthrobacter sp. Cr_A7]|uniref:ABC transporter ATP-binding protein n=1 Tax=Arthrobacter sp. Cr_A7 TaxID=3031017 RepID=UPI0023DAAE9C|nr:ATP-binding cassette domain-containing protein [Arthrobacter sp. Cr_A7]MDF2049399.1 ATP-binding cassette domain-containing protein [Arthrobacter sp. Cr_A7]
MPYSAEPAMAAGIREFTFHDGGGPVLQRVDVAVVPGTLTAVLGTSGSGKTTLGRLLAGWLPPGPGGNLTGFLELTGTRLQFNGDAGDPRIDPAQWGRQVGFVPQDAGAVLSTVRATVAEELAFGLESSAMDRTAMVAAVEQTAGLLGLRNLLGRHPARLSGGQLQRLAIGCAIITRPPVLIMDEPFASLDAAGALELGDLVRGLVKAGTAVVILSQMVDGLVREADHWIVLADGTVKASGTPAALEAGPPAVLAGIRRIHDGPWAGGAAPVPRQAGHSVPALELRGVSFGYRQDGRPARQGFAWQRRRGSRTPDIRSTVLQGIDLAVPPGEIVAVTGPNGAGKSTLLRHFNGLLRPTTGTVLVQGEDIAGRPVGSTAAAVGLLFQHPREQLFERTVLREVRFGLDRLFGQDEAGERAAAALAAVGLSAAAREHPAELPASRQRLLALATVLARKPAVLALDEPTVALDGDGLAVLDAAVRSAAAEGAAVVLVTHDLGYARSAAHRTIALDAGRLVEA